MHTLYGSVYVHVWKCVYSVWKSVCTHCMEVYIYTVRINVHTTLIGTIYSTGGVLTTMITM